MCENLFWDWQKELNLEYLLLNIGKAKQVLSTFIGGLLVLLVRLYQITLSQWLGGQCRFVPTCSEYAKEVIERFGPLRGSWLAAVRLLRCNPCCRGGCDAPPSA
ncbi:MAG: membrane protein insertion efficiency factor YidD [Sedimentisphaerales bacterium]|nr:membrane protein insertion efficiency factor YidD [Sedimentisphaerales bacterium]